MEFSELSEVEITRLLSSPTETIIVAEKQSEREREELRKLE
jgi:hypothetical protein